MVSVVDLGIRAHEPDTRMIVVTFCSITVIPLAVKLYQKPEVDLAVKLRITVNTHVLDPRDVQKHLAAAKPGDIIQFGSYEQDGNKENGTEDIEWIVLEKSDETIFPLLYPSLCHLFKYLT